MNLLLVIITVTGLLFSGAESFKISQKDYENIDQILEFGVQVFLNCLDKVKEATEKMVKDDMLRTNRIAIQNHWNSFKDTANRISVEERGNGVQDDLIVGARTVQRLVLYYKDDIKKIFHVIAVEQNVQLYLPVVNTFKGSFERAKANEIWGNLAAHYFPDAPPIESDPMEFLCYLLSTSAVETFIVNVLKVGTVVMAEYKKIDFNQMKERAWELLLKYNEIYITEKKRENDDFILLVSVTSRLFVFYWDRFLNSTDTPLLQQQYEDTLRRMKDQKFEEKLQELFKPIQEMETVNDFLQLHFSFAKGFYEVGFGFLFVLYLSTPERFTRTVWTVAMATIVHGYHIYENIPEMGIFSEMKTLYFKAVDLAVFLGGTKEFQYFRETHIKKWMAFRKEFNTLVKEEKRKSHILFPQVRAIGRMLWEKFVAFLDRVNADVHDDTVRNLSMKWASLRDICIKKLLTSGVLTQDQLNKAESIFQKTILGFHEKYMELTVGMDQKRAEELLTGLVKVLMVGLNYIYAPLTQAWNFVAN